MALECVEFKPFAKNTLRGFATILIPSIRLRIKDVAIHTKGESQWAALPAKPQIKDSKVVVSAEGKAQYTNILEFADRPTGDAFSRTAITAVLKFNPQALEASNG